MTGSYFPPTPPHDADDADQQLQSKMSAPTQPNASLVPNAAAPPPNGTTGTKDAPGRMSLKLSHLPSRQIIKPVYPRSPSSVSVHFCLRIMILRREWPLRALSSRIYASMAIYISIYSHTSQIDPNNPPWPAFRGYHE